MKRETGFRTILLIAILVLCGISLAPTLLVFSKSNDSNLPLEERPREIYKRENPKIASKAMNLGLDLAGGTHIVVEIDRSKLDESTGRDVLDRSLEIIRNRVDQYGLSEPIITRSGDNRIVASLAGMGAEDARRLIGSTALLEFKLVAETEEFATLLTRMDATLAARQRGAGAPAAEKAKPRSEAESVFGRVVGDTTAAADDVDPVEGLDANARPFTSLLTQLGRDVGVPSANVERVRRILADREIQQLVSARHQFLWSRDEETLPGDQKVRRLYLLKRRAEMTGATIADATFQHAQGGLNAGEMEVSLTFKGIGPKEFARVTGANVGKQLAIVLDSVVYSAPVIQGRIPNGRASITGVGSVTEAKQLAVVLRAGALPVPMNIVELRSVGPTLGEQNIRNGLLAGIASLALVAVFMLYYYRTAGIIANIALVLNMVIIFAVLSAFRATLTLPGIAGIALTIGMAVDANVLIFERIREELKAGKAFRLALDTGYKKALSAILDSNITTFGTAAVLYYIGVGPIKGFGLTLMIGLAASMYTALGVTRLLFDLVLARRDGRSISVGNGFAWFHKVDLRVVTGMRYYVIGTLLITAVAVGAMAVRGFNLGIDFTGGHVYRVKFEEAPDVESIRASVEQAGLASPKVQTYGAQSDNRLMISVQQVANDSAALEAVKAAVAPGFVEGEDTVGPSVGSDLRWAAIWSIVASFILIVLYIWLRFGRNGLGYGLACAIGSIHDAVITVGIFALLGFEMNLPFVAAVLTVIGYSLNDSIVIFDRIREMGAVSGSRNTFAQNVNIANNQCLSRSAITHVTTLFSIIALVVFGGSSLQDFTVAMLIGVVVGVFSTYSVASPFVVWWDRRRVKAPSKA